jgi:hypothetical protein
MRFTKKQEGLRRREAAGAAAKKILGQHPQSVEELASAVVGKLIFLKTASKAAAYRIMAKSILERELAGMSLLELAREIEKMSGAAISQPYLFSALSRRGAGFKIRSGKKVLVSLR